MAELKLAGYLIVALTLFISVIQGDNNDILTTRSMVISPYSASISTAFFSKALWLRNLRFGVLVINAQPPSEMSLISKDSFRRFYGGRGNKSHAHGVNESGDRGDAALPAGIQAMKKRSGYLYRHRYCHVLSGPH